MPTAPVVTEAYTNRLRAEMEKHAGNAGKVLHVEAFEEAKGGGWIAVFDTEYAALKVHYKYLGTTTVKFGISPVWKGWYVSTRSE